MEILSKATSRKIYLEKRKALTIEKKTEYSQKIHDLLFSRIMMHRFSPIHIFMPIQKQSEVDTSIIINTLRKDFAPDLYLPKIVENNTLLHIPFVNNTLLNANSLGILEPENILEGMDSESFFAKYSNEDILVIVPLLAFDKLGHRVGYGKGYYDRFLSFAGSNTTIIGVSFFEAIEAISDANSEDIKLNYCVTPNRVYTF